MKTFNFLYLLLFILFSCNKKEQSLPVLEETTWQMTYQDDAGGHGVQIVYFGTDGKGTLSSDSYTAGSNPNWKIYGPYAIPLTWRLENGTIFLEHEYIDTAALYPYEMRGNYFKSGNKVVMKINGIEYFQKK